MSIVVKEWQPAEGCKSCMNAQRIMHDQTRISSAGSALAIKKIRAQEDRIKELEQQLKEAQDAIPVEMLDLVRFLAETWDAIDQFVYQHCDGEALMKYPVIQGTRNQMNLRAIGKQPYEPKRLKRAAEWLLNTGEHQ